MHTLKNLKAFAAKCSKCFWPFSNIMHEKIKINETCLCNEQYKTWKFFKKILKVPKIMNGQCLLNGSRQSIKDFENVLLFYLKSVYRLEK